MDEPLDFYVRLNQRIRTIMFWRGVTRQRMGELLGMPRTNLSSRLREDEELRKWNADELVDVARVLRVPIGVLYDDHGLISR